MARLEELYVLAAQPRINYAQLKDICTYKVECITISLNTYGSKGLLERHLINIPWQQRYCTVQEHNQALDDNVLTTTMGFYF